MDTIFKGRNAYKHIEKLAVEIGARTAGSPEDSEAADYIKGYFEGLGLDTSVQEFEIETGYMKNSTLEVLKPYGESISCAGMPMLGKTGPGGIEGELIRIESTRGAFSVRYFGQIGLFPCVFHQGDHLFHIGFPAAAIPLTSRNFLEK